MNLLKISIYFILLIIYINETYAEKKIVCYYGSWSTYRNGDGKCVVEDLDPKLCTHLIYTFVGLNENGTIRILDPWCDLPDNYGLNGFGRFVDLKKRNPKAKTLLAIGGWNEGSEKYSKVMNNPELRSNFIQDALSFIQKYKFDGLDFDWEYPNQRGGIETDKRAYIATIKQLKSAFQPHNLLLSSAVAAAKSSAEQSYIIPELSKHLDIINLMTYDLHGAWDHFTGHNSGLYPGNDQLNIEDCVNYWLSNGADPDKIVLGMPLYGRTFKLANRDNYLPGAPAIGPGPAGIYTGENGILGYNEIIELTQREDWVMHWDNESLVPFLIKDDIWITFDNEYSIALKTEYALQRGLGGAMVWSVETDDIRGKSGTKYPLLKTINYILNGGTVGTTIKPPPVQSTTIKPSPPVQSTTIKPTPPVPDCKEEGFVRDLNDCGVFYECVKQQNGSFKKFKFECPDGLYFNELTIQCDWQYNVNC